MTSAREEVEALLNLVDASRIESDKVYKQSDALTHESLEMHREIESIKLELSQRVSKLGLLEKEHDSIAQVSSERLKALNTFRVELYQSRLLNENYQKQIQRAREYFLSQKKKAPVATDTPMHDKSQQLILKTLEKDKGTIKKIYDQILDDYQKIKKNLKEGTARLKKAPEDALAQEVEKLNSEIKEKKRTLEQAKSELIGIEREIFVVKKGLQQQGVGYQGTVRIS